MRNMKIGKKLLLGFGLLIVFVGGAVALGYAYIWRVERQNELLAAEIVPVMTTNIELERTVYGLFSAIDTYRLTEADAAGEVVQQYFAKVEAALNEAKRELEANPQKSGLEGIVDGIYPAFLDLRNMVQGKMKVISSKKNALERSMHTGDELQSILKQDILQYNYRQAELEEDESRENQHLALIRAYEDLLYDITDMRRHLFVAFSHQNIDEVKSVSALANTTRQKIASISSLPDPDPSRASIYEKAKNLVMQYMTEIDEQVNLYVRVQELHSATTPLKTRLDRKSVV